MENLELLKLKFFVPLVGLSIGIWVSDILPSGFSFPLITLGISLFVWVVSKKFTRNPLSAFKFYYLHFIWILFLFAGIGSLDYQFNCVPSLNYRIANEPLSFKGVIVEASTKTEGDNYKVNIKSVYSKDQDFECRNLFFILKTDGFIGNEGDVISFSGIPLKFSNKDYNNRMRHQGVSYYLNSKTENIKKIGEENSINVLFYKLRENLIIRLEKSSLSKDASNFLISILLGDRSFISSDVRFRLNGAGLAHILSLSGMHVALMLGFISTLLFPLAYFRKNRLRKYLSILFIWIYVLLSGASPSTVRAAIMATFLIGAYLLERKNSPLNALLAAALIILIYNPFNLWDIGFQLSFVCVAGILIFTKKLNPIDHHRHPLSYKLIDSTLIAIVTTFCSWPLLSYYFKKISLLFLPANIILLPALPLFAGVGTLYLMLLVVNIDFIFLAQGIDRFYSIFLETVDLLSMSGKAFLNFNCNEMMVINWMAILIFIAWFIHSDQSRKKLFKGVIAVITFSIPLFTVLNLSINQSDSNDFLRFDHSFTSIDVQINQKEKTYRLSFPRRSVASSSWEDINIISVDRIIHADSLALIGSKTESKNNFLIVGPESDNKQMAELISNKNFSKIILHAGVGGKRKQKLLELIEEKEWPQIYSLRDNGSLEFEL